MDWQAVHMSSALSTHLQQAHTRKVVPRQPAVGRQPKRADLPFLAICIKRCK